MPRPTRSAAQPVRRPRPILQGAPLLAALALAATGRPLAAQPAAAAPAAPSAPSTPAVAAPAPTRVVTLPNGLDVIVVENHAVPLATAKLVVRTGAMHQTPEATGVPHLFEHMLFKGYRSYQGRTFGQESAELQAGYNGTTSEEMVTYYLTLPSPSVYDGIGLLARLVREARFEREELRTERAVVLGELERDRSDPRRLLVHEVSRRLWGDDWVRKNAGGDGTALFAVTPKQLDAIYARWYVPNNAALVVTGDVDPTRVVEAARRAFGGWTRGSDAALREAVPAPKPLAQPQVVVLEGDVSAVTMLMEWHGPRARDAVADTYDADVLAEVVNHEESPLQQRLVDAGSFESARLGYQTLAHTGPITFSGTTTMEKLAPALTALAGQLTLMPNDGYFAADALRDAAKRRRVADALDREEAVSLAHALAYSWAVTGLAYERTYLDSLDARRPADLQRFARRYLAGRPFVLGLLVPNGKGKEALAYATQFVSFVREETAP